MAMSDVVDKLFAERNLSDEEFFDLIKSDEYDEKLFCKADEKRREIYGDEVYLRGLIEFTNYCKNNCYYCGIRRSNANACRYRLSLEEIMAACKTGYELGFHTFVLQGGEDPFFTEEKICKIVSSIRKEYPDCAITLSIGEKDKESYQAFFDAGANRYLLRHETASDEHYRKLHPEEMSLSNRKRCLFDLKEIGYQVGAGFMVGSPFQKIENLIEDLRLLQELNPDMIGMGPFISQSDTPFALYESGDLKLTLRLISILRLLFPHALIPATTALGTIHPEGWEMGLKAGANVLMLNVTPPEAQKKYLLYDNKNRARDDAKSNRENIEERVRNIGYKVVNSVGDVIK